MSLTEPEAGSTLPGSRSWLTSPALRTVCTPSKLFVLSLGGSSNARPCLRPVTELFTEQMSNKVLKKRKGRKPVKTHETACSGARWFYVPRTQPSSADLLWIQNLAGMTRRLQVHTQQGREGSASHPLRPVARSMTRRKGRAPETVSFLRRLLPLLTFRAFPLSSCRGGSSDSRPPEPSLPPTAQRQELCRGAEAAHPRWTRRPGAAPPAPARRGRFPGRGDPAGRGGVGRGLLPWGRGLPAGRLEQGATPLGAAPHAPGPAGVPGLAAEGAGARWRGGPGA
ncbi:uncharacterized protein LOC135184275 [Pogoniulus pusillus]|uniref:uncharacterized protein LOC135184275 n=1 Tax=Pogoniulus pusillus TaxID=488313 RepID=UPI0030B994C3